MNVNGIKIATDTETDTDMNILRFEYREKLIRYAGYSRLQEIKKFPQKNTFFLKNNMSDHSCRVMDPDPDGSEIICNLGSGISS
jgi:hypothetical protein